MMENNFLPMNANSTPSRRSQPSRFIGPWLRCAAVLLVVFGGGSGCQTYTFNPTSDGRTSQKQDAGIGPIFGATAGFSSGIVASRSQGEQKGAVRLHTIGGTICFAIPDRADARAAGDPTERPKATRKNLKSGDVSVVRDAAESPKALESTNLMAVPDPKELNAVPDQKERLAIPDPKEL